MKRLRRGFEYSKYGNAEENVQSISLPPQGDSTRTERLRPARLLSRTMDWS
jgi:hypothetical protein